MKTILPIFVLFAMGLPLHAQGPTLDLEGSLDLSGGTERRSFEGGSNTKDGFYLFNPSFLAVSRHSPRTLISVNYSPEFQLFVRHHELNGWNHAARLDVTRKVSPRLLLDIGDSFVSTVDPSRQLANGFLLLPRSRYRENAFYARGDYNLSPVTTLSLRFDNTVVRYGLEAIPAELRTGLLDQMGNALSASLSRNFREGEKLSATYTLLQLSLLESSGLPPNLSSGLGPTHYFTFGYLNSVRPDLVFGGTVGVIRAGIFTYALSAQVRKLVGFLWLEADYSRTLSFFGGPSGENAGPAQLGGGLLASNRYEMVSGGVTGDLLNRVGLKLRLTAARNGSGSLGRNGRSLMGLARLDFRLTERISLYSAADLYGQDLNKFAGTPRSRHRFYAGLEWSFSKRRTVMSRATPAAVPTRMSGGKEE